MVYRTTPKMTERKAATRTKLLQAAIRLFGRNGFHAATVPQIVEEAQSSTGAFYLNFRNKEDAFAAALAAVGEQIARELNKAIAGAGDDVLDQMRAAIETLVFCLADNPAEARILIVESSGLSARLEQARRSIIGSHCRSVEMALSACSKRLPPFNVSVVAASWVGAVHEATYQWLSSPPDLRIPADALAQEIANFNLRGIGAGKDM